MPSGPLHFGSIIAALGSYLQARSQQGSWLVRIEDLDHPLVKPEAADSILRDLDRLGLHWDESPVYQSQRIDRYEAVLAALETAGHTFPCGGSRTERKGIYHDTSRGGLQAGRQPRSIRFRTPDGELRFNDGLYGTQTAELRRDVGDFVVRRADGIVAYQLAVVVDDADAGITEIVRGVDLIDTTMAQILLQQQLQLPTPDYLHLPLAVDANQRKISKQHHAPAIADQPAGEVLWQALAFLGQSPADELRQAGAGELLTWAITHWDPNRIPRAKAPA